jgi:hypothetical protein
MNAIHWCNDLGEVIEFVAYVVLSAPADFPPEDNMNLERAFQEFRHGFDCAASELAEDTLSLARKMLEEAYEHYKADRVNEGAWKLQEMQQLLMRN